MERVRLDTLSPRGWPAVAVTVGNFDGVHRGHQALVREAVAAARAASGTAVALTFDPHPSRVLSPERALASLMTLDQKAEARVNNQSVVSSATDYGPLTTDYLLV